jgi:hypothetical protein
LAASAAGHVYSGWCMLGLPYRRPKAEKDQIWRITTDFADITVQSGTYLLNSLAARTNC